MFGRKRAIKRQTTLTLTDEAGCILYTGNLTGMNVQDDLVVALSVEFFDDPAPCEIHRNAVLSRIFLSIEEALPSWTPISINTLDPDILRLFSAYPSAQLALMEGHSL